MNKQIYSIILLLTCKICSAQNLIPNGDFEQYIGCPVSYSQLDSALFWFNPAVNPGPGGSPDYFNQCSTDTISGVPNGFLGYQPAHSGGGYGGIIIFTQFPFNPNQREYMEVQLLSPLVANSCYHFEMYVNRGNTSQLATDNLGVYFSNTAVAGIMYIHALPFIPQINNTNGNLTDTVNWVLVSGDYTATGGENYLIIGNFNDDANTTFTLENPDGTLEIAYYFIDDVSLSLCTGVEEENENAGITIYPNPAMDKLNVTVNSKELSEIILYDIASRKVTQKKFTNSFSLNIEQLAKGIYIYEVKNKNGVIKKGKVVKD